MIIDRMKSNDVEDNNLYSQQVQQLENSTQKMTMKRSTYIAEEIYYVYYQRTQKHTANQQLI